MTPHPHRGDTIAAGVVVLTTFALLLEARFGGTWSAGARLLVVGAIAVLVASMSVLAEGSEESVPRAYESVLYVASFILAILALGDLADALGANSPLGASGTIVWVGLLLVGLCAWFAARRNSAVMTLLGALTAVVVVLAFVNWVFSPDGVQTFRWILLLCAIGLTLGAVHQRDLRRRHAVSLADATALTVVALGLTLAVEALLGSIVSRVGLGGLGGSHGGPFGWELVLLAFGFGLIAYGCVDRERVPGFLGVLVLAVFLAVAAPPAGDGPSLIGWPLFLVLAAGALLTIGLRPRAELPPEPAAGGSPPAPTTPMPVTPPPPPTAPTEPVVPQPPPPPPPDGPAAA